MTFDGGLGNIYDMHHQQRLDNVSLITGPDKVFYDQLRIIISALQKAPKCID